MCLEVCLAMTFCLSLHLLNAGESEEKKITARPLAFESPTYDSQPLLIGSRRELFIDNYLIGEFKGSAVRHLFQMTPATTKASDVAMTCDEDWEGPWCRYAKFIQDKGVVRAWYMGHHTYDYRNKDGKKVPGRLCYAFSQDGITFKKPNLGRYDWEGNKSNNVLFDDQTFKAANNNWITMHNFSPFIDTNPEVPDDERYKAVSGYGEGLGGNTGLYTFKSSDGIDWKIASKGPIVSNKHRLDSTNQGFWDAEKKRYTVYFRHLRNSEGEEGYPVKNWRRDIRVVFSKDFINWTEPEWLVYHRDDGRPGMDLTHLYTNEIKPYKRAPHIYLGFPSRYEEFAPMLIASRDGVHFYRWMKHPIISRMAPADRDKNRSNHIWQEMIEFPGEPNKYSMYCSENLAIKGFHEDGSFPRFRRYTIRKDGFVSVRAEEGGGEIITKALKVKGKRLTLNYNATLNDGGLVRVEILDSNRRPIPEYALKNCDVLTGDVIDQTITWKGKENVELENDQPIHLRFVLKNADLFSFKFIETVQE